MTQENEQKNTSFEDVWGRRESANIISGKTSTPLCLGFLSVISWLCRANRTSEVGSPRITW